MRLILELVEENKLSCIINIHDVQLAKMFCPRVVGLQQGLVVFDGTNNQIDNDVLTTIYGEEDWNLKKKPSEEEE